MTHEAQHRQARPGAGMVQLPESHRPSAGAQDNAAAPARGPGHSLATGPWTAASWLRGSVSPSGEQGRCQLLPSEGLMDGAGCPTSAGKPAEVGHLRRGLHFPSARGHRQRAPVCPFASLRL